MPKVNVLTQAMNVGVIDPDKLTRVDQNRLRLAAETQTNFLPMTTGKMFHRPGTGYLGSTDSGNEARIWSFIKSDNTAALLEFTSELMRIWNDDELVSRPAVTAAISNGDFGASTGWTLTASSGATCTISGNFLNLTASARGSSAYAIQEVTVNEAATEHALHIVIDRGPVTFRCGSTSGGDDYIGETSLREGAHSLAFTPTGSSFFIKILSEDRPLRRVKSIAIESSGVVSLPTPWTDPSIMRLSQSADVVFVAASGTQPRRIERRSDRSWSVVKYFANDGPFILARTRQVKLKASVTEGNGTLTADGPIFTADHVGALFRLTQQNGFSQSVSLASENSYSDPFRVTGLIVSGEYNDRNWTYTTTGTWAGTLKWKRSFDGPDSGYKDFRNASGSTTIGFTSNVSGQTNGDRDDNAIVWYKLGFDGGDYTSGSATAAIAYTGSGGDGIGRVTGYTSETEVDIEVVKPFKGTDYTDQWQEGEWSGVQGWPEAGSLFEGRLWFGGADRIWGSVSDSFESFDDTVEGDSGPILRSIATGGVNRVRWIMGLQRLLFGTTGTETSARSSSFDEPLTPTNTTLKDSSTIGSAGLDPLKVDTTGIFVDRSGRSLFETKFGFDQGDYQTGELSKLCKTLFKEGVSSLAVQRRPDTRIWIVRGDGKAICLLYEPAQEVVAFVPVETDGDFESVAVLPGDEQDRPYFVVKRTIGGSTVRYIEKLALDSEVAPDTQTKVMDAFVADTNSPASTTIGGLDHLEGKNVVVWADGAPVSGKFTVSNGSITLDSAVADYVVGLPYTSKFKSARMAYGAAGGTALLQKQRVDALGIIMADFTREYVKYGPTFDKLDPLPTNRNGIAADTVVPGVGEDEQPFVFRGSWAEDGRYCIQCTSPGTLSVLATVAAITTNA